MKVLHWMNLILAELAVLPTAAHVLELPNKLALNGPLWLAVQQHLYRGWGPFYGGPVEIAALATSVTLAALRRHDRPLAQSMLVATLAYCGMLVAFFVFNNPVNAAVNGWTAATLPSDWKTYRMRWETGHALAFCFSLVALIACARAWLLAREPRRAGRRRP